MQHVSWFDARTLLHAEGSLHAAATERVALSSAIGRVLAEPLKSPLPVPHYNSSAMDGYALAGRGPWQLLASQESQPGENVHRKTVPLEAGQATPILTGGLLPPGADAVLRLEHARLYNDGDLAMIEALPHFFERSPHLQPAVGDDIRRAGEELAAGATVLAAGIRLGARHIGSLATLGFDSLPVYTQPTVALAYTGNEIITGGLPGPGEVRDAFSPQFPFIIESFGARVTSTVRLQDSAPNFHHWLDHTAADILMLTGGSSTSDVDWVRRVLTELGATYIFESVAIRPGHPALAALLPDGRLVLGLPGNPLAAHVALYSYLPAVLAGIFGQPLAQLPTGTLTAAVPGYSTKDLRLIPVTIEVTPGGVRLTPQDKTRSHMLTGFASADALALLPPEGAVAEKNCQFLGLPV